MDLEHKFIKEFIIKKRLVSMLLLSQVMKLPMVIPVRINNSNMKAIIMMILSKIMVSLDQEGMLLEPEHTLRLVEEQINKRNWESML